MTEVNESSAQGTRTRDRILSTAARLFSQKGYEHTPLSHVAREAQVSKALILWHFDSKEDLFRAALGRTLEPYRSRRRRLDTLDEADQIRRLIDLYAKFTREHGYSVRFIVDMMVRDSGPAEVMNQVSELYALFRGLLSDAIQHGRDAGKFRPDVSPTLDASLLLTSLDGILMERFIVDEASQTNSEELLDHLKQAALRRLLY